MPILGAHVEHDVDSVPFGRVDASVNELAAKGHDVTFMVYPEVGHDPLRQQVFLGVHPWIIKSEAKRRGASPEVPGQLGGVSLIEAAYRSSADRWAHEATEGSRTRSLRK